MLFYLFTDFTGEDNFLKISKEIKAVEFVKMYDGASVTYYLSCRFNHYRGGPIQRHYKRIFPSVPIDGCQEIGVLLQQKCPFRFETSPLVMGDVATFVTLLDNIFQIFIVVKDFSPALGTAAIMGDILCSPCQAKKFLF